MPEGNDDRAIYPSLRGKKVLITGGGSGIGAGIVEAFARQGCDVTFIDILNGPSEAHAAKTGSRFLRVDLTDTAKSTQLIRDLVDEHGPFDVLVNNAANDDRHKVEEVTEAYWDDRLNVNLKHHFFSAQAVLPGMRAKGGGSIISLGSISWHLGLPDLVLYQTSKAAIEGLTRSLARDLGPRQYPRQLRRPRQCENAAPGAMVHAGGRSRDRPVAVHQAPADARRRRRARCLPRIRRRARNDRA